MNETFAPPLVESIRGVALGGGAMLTEQGHKMWVRSVGSTPRGRAELLVISRAASDDVAKQE